MMITIPADGGYRGDHNDEQDEHQPVELVALRAKAGEREIHGVARWTWKMVILRLKDE